MAVLRMILAPVRSGTTAFLHQMSQSKYVDTATGLMREGVRSGGCPDYSIYHLSSSYPFLVYKASFGHRSEMECSYQPFRSSQDVEAIRPVFLFRDPVQTLNSWRRAGWIGADLHRFFLAYRWVLNLHTRALNESAKTLCLTYEHMAAQPEMVFPQLFHHWEIPFDSALLIWRTSPGNCTIKHRSLDAQRAKMAQHIDQGIHRNLTDGAARFRLVINPVVLTHREVCAVNREFRDEYSSLHTKSQCNFSWPAVHTETCRTVVGSQGSSGLNRTGI